MGEEKEKKGVTEKNGRAEVGCEVKKPNKTLAMLVRDWTSYGVPLPGTH